MCEFCQTLRNGDFIIICFCLILLMGLRKDIRAI